MTIEQGKFYRTRDGRKAGPIEERPQPHDGFPFGGRNESGLYELYTRDGFVVHGGTTAADLVAEWEDPDPIPLIRQMREALGPFSQGWQAALDAFGDRPTTLANFGAVASDHVGAVDFRRAHAAIAAADEFLKA